MDASDDELSEMLFGAWEGLPTARVEELERRVEADSDDVGARAELLGHFANLRQLEKFVPHLKYLIVHRPGIKELGFPFVSPQLGPELFEEIRSLWMAAVERESDLKVALHALRAIGKYSFVDAQRLVNLGLSSAPEDMEWFQRSASFYLDLGRRDQSMELLERASDLFQKALARAEPHERATLWTQAVQCALEARQDAFAAALAGDMLSADDWFSVKMKHLKHYAHSALGEVALRQGDLDEAERRLVKSAQDIAGFYIDHGGARLELAKQLAEHGRRAAVITFLEEMLRQWPKGSDKLTPWLEELRTSK